MLVSGHSPQNNSGVTATGRPYFGPGLPTTKRKRMLDAPILLYKTHISYRAQRILKMISCRPPPTGNGPGPEPLDGPIGRFLLPIGGGLC